MKTEITMFIQPRILQQIGHLRIAKFLDSFTGDLASVNLVAPPLFPMNHYYFAELADFLATTENLPPRFLEAVSAIETAAAPEHAERLKALLQHHVPHCPLSHPVDRALELWFTAPELLSQMSSSSSTSVPPNSAESSLSHPPTFSLSGPSDLAPTHRPTHSPTHGDADSDALRSLASLSPMEYDRTRKESARNLGIRVETLDAEVTRLRNQIRDDAAFHSALSTLHSPLPWPEPVNGAELLTQIVERFRHYLFLPLGAPEAFTLWFTGLWFTGSHPHY